MNKLLVSAIVGTMVSFTGACYSATKEDPGPMLTEEPRRVLEVYQDWRVDRDAAGAGVLVNGLHTPEGATCRYEVAANTDGGWRETQSGIVSGDSGQDLPISVPLEGVRPPFD